MTTRDRQFMRMAIRLARRGLGRPSREPLVGAVVVAGDRVVGSSFANEHPSTAAILAALADAGQLASGATLYTNIQPCGDAADVDACVDSVSISHVARVVVGVTRGNPEPPQMSVSVLGQLRSRGIEVETGACEQACRELNERYFKYSATGVPFVTVKLAQSLDGRIATSTGDSKWITSASAHRFVHRLRSEHDAIMVGIGTVLADDPELTVRLVKGRNPLRVIVDSRLRIPPGARVLSDCAGTRTVIVTTESSAASRQRAIEKRGAEVLRLPSSRRQSGIDLPRLLRELGRRGIASVLVEGGKGITTSLFVARAVDRLVTIIAPKIIGEGIEAIGDLGISRLDEAITFSSVKTRRIGPDIMFDARLK